MNVRRFDDVGAFLERVEPYLMRNEAAHNLILGLCSTLMTSNRFPHPPYLACCEAGDAITGVALRTPPNNLVLSEYTEDAAVDAFAQDAYQVYGELPGLVAPLGAGDIFSRRWQTLTGMAGRRSRAERIYRLDRVIPVNGVSGSYCPATTADCELLIDWNLAFAAEALDGTTREHAEGGVRWRLESAPTQSGLRLWVDNGRPVSMAGYGGLTPNGIRIGPVYTPPEYRGHGYASALTAALSQELLDMGRAFVFLFTDLGNLTSNHIYQAIGYQPVCDVDEYQFEAA